ncbi:ricin-type beta-trefoil lectin domain protein [Spirillospora sp. NPDC127200]
MATATMIPTSASAQAPPTSPKRTASTTSAPGKYQAANRVLTLQNRFTQACLDNSHAYGLRGFPCNGLDFQRWNIILRSNIGSTVTNIATNRCLDDSNEYGLRAITCNGHPGHQEWIVIDNGGYLELRNRQTYRCLDDSPLGVRTHSCNSQDYQRWKFW